MPQSQRGFATGLRKGKKQLGFTPTKEQIELACTRIIGVLHRYGGFLRASSPEDAVKQLCGLVYNRGCQLGRYKQDEFTTTIRCAYRRMISDGRLNFCDEGIGTTVKPRQKRVHQQRIWSTRRRRVA